MNTAIALGLFFGLGLGLGVLLISAPFVWPAVRPALVGWRAPVVAVIRVLRSQLTMAGLHRVSVGSLVLISAIIALVAGALTLVFVPVVVIVMIASVSAFILPISIVRWRARSRRAAAGALWPDIVDHLVSAVRSGLALPDSVATVAHSGPESTRQAFLEFEQNYEATGNFGVAVDALKARLADPVADRILETLRMSRDVGGSELPTVLRNLAAYLRQEAAIRSEVLARQTWVMNSARLGVAAPWVILLLLVTRPEAAAAYNSGGGVLLILGGVCLTAIAYRLMLAIGRIPPERRWFA